VPLRADAARVRERTVSLAAPRMECAAAVREPRSRALEEAETFVFALQRVGLGLATRLRAKGQSMASTSMRLPGTTRSGTSRQPARREPSRWSWRLGRLFGIEVRVHATFLILLLWVAATHVMAGHGLATAASGVAFVVAVFAIIVLHELGHALTARRFGIQTRDITLLPIGGVARLERTPSKPSEELLVAIAGPAVNVGLALLFFGSLMVMGAVEDVGRLSLVGGPFLAKLMWTNVGLAVFNIIPAFPMDGGRVLRALLAMRMSYVRATDWAATVGQGVALVFGLVGLFVNPFLVFIALFVWIGAQGEARLAHVHASLAGVPVSGAMVTRFAVVAPDEPVSVTVSRMLGGFQDDVPVVEGTKLVGVLGREDVLRAAVAGETDARVGAVMRTEFAVVKESDSLELALERLQASGQRSIPVVREGEVVGVLPIDNVAYVLRIRDERAGAR
jgi:Zn-dependent protease/CBS domain-containing protein